MLQNASLAQVYLEELKTMILGEVSTLGEKMWSLYEELIAMNNIVVDLHGLKQKHKYYVKNLKVVQSTIVSLHEWSMQYKGVLLELGNKSRKEVELEKPKVQMLIQNNKQLTFFISNT